MSEFLPVSAPGADVKCGVSTFITDQGISPARLADVVDRYR
ncbi:hypothetical protein [Streptomyces sp. CA-251247]